MLRLLFATALGIVSLTGCQSTAGDAHRSAMDLQEVARSDRRWTGLTVTKGGRLFVNFPRWSDEVPVSVGEVVNGVVVPWPNAALQDWKPGVAPEQRFVCVQSVVADLEDTLWVLDPANPSFAGVVQGGPKLMRFDLNTNKLLRSYSFAEPVINNASYLNDVRIDLAHGVAYLTDSGDGALIVLDLQDGQARRLLDHHPATSAEPIDLEIEGRIWRAPNGRRPEIHADGIGYCAEKDRVYFQALTGRTLYSIDAKALRDPNLSAGALQNAVVREAQSGASDGLIVDSKGRVLLSALEANAIRRFDPKTSSTETLIAGPRIRWPDSFAFGPGGDLLFTTAMIHLGDNPPEPFRIYRLVPHRK